MTHSEKASSSADLTERPPSVVEMGQRQHTDKVQLSLFDGISTIVGLMVGSGIFSSSSEIHTIVKSPGMAILIWLITGLLSLTGALCYAELGTLIPGSGGEAQYLQKAFGGWATFVFNLSSILILKPATVAVLTIAMAKYMVMLIWCLLQRPVPIEGYAKILEDFPGTTMAISLVAIFVVTLSASISTKASLKIQEILTYGKIAALGFIIVMSLYTVAAGDRTAFTANLSSPFSGTNLNIVEYASALNNGLFGFDGWNNLNIIAGDLSNPGRTLPLAIWISMAAVIILYCLTIFGYYAVLPVSTIATSATVGVDFGKAVAGYYGSILMAFFVVNSTFGSALSSMATSSEIIILAADNGHIPKFFGRISKHMGTAQNAYIMQAILSIIYVLFVDLDGLIHIYTIPSWIFYAACVIVLLVMRSRMPNAHRPYRVWLSTPILFLGACIFLLSTSLWQKTGEVAVSIALVLLGIPIYFMVIKS